MKERKSYLISTSDIDGLEVICKEEKVDGSVDIILPDNKKPVTVTPEVKPVAQPGNQSVVTQNGQYVFNNILHIRIGFHNINFFKIKMLRNYIQKCINIILVVL